MLIVLLLLCLKEYSTCINYRLSKSVKYPVSSLCIIKKIYITNITLLLILCLNESPSHLIQQGRTALEPQNDGKLLD